jgi:hypothetical protein
MPHLALLFLWPLLSRRFILITHDHVVVFVIALSVARSLVGVVVAFSALGQQGQAAQCPPVVTGSHMAW